MAKTIIEIVKQYLQTNGFDGLYLDDCGCFNDDLMPEACPNQNCAPGYRRRGSGDSLGCWIIHPDKEEV